MSVVTPWQDSFNGGELSPNMMARVKQDLWGVSLASMIGYLPMLQGPAEACPGFIFVSKARALGARLIDFEFNSTQGYVIEASAGKFRFYTNDVRIDTAPNVPFEVDTPWTAAQVAELDWCAIGDLTYFFHPDVAPQELRRTGAETFTLLPLSMRNGPWESRNGDEGLGVMASGTTGSVTLTSSSPIYEAGDVGGLFEIEFGGLATIPTWENGITVSPGTIWQWDGNVYQCMGGATRTGNTAPVHREGTEWDGSGSGTDINGKGPYGVQWLYLHDRYGQLLITGYSSPVSVTATVQKRLASSGTSQWRWRFGAFSNRRGWPQTGCIWKGHLVVAKDFTPHASVKGDFSASVNFAIRNELGEISRDMAFTEPLSNPNQIRWMMPLDTLQIGTAAAEHLLVQASQGVGVGPGNVDAVMETEYGSARARAIRADGRTIFIQAGQSKLHQFARSEYRDGYDNLDLCRYADHMGNTGFAELAWQAEPRRLIWARTHSGELRCAIYVPSEQALGWAQRPLAEGLVCTSMAVISDPNGRQRQLWITAETGGESWVMRLAPIRKTGDASLNQVMSDAAWAYDGAPTNVIVAPHLAGRSVEIVADGRLHRPVTLDGTGAGVLDFSASKIIVGLPFPAEIKTLPMEAGSDNGSAQTKLKRINKVGIRVLNSDGFALSVQGGAFRPFEQQRGNSPMDTAFSLFTGDEIQECNSGYDQGGQMTIRRINPKPSTILGLIAHSATGAG